MDTYRSPDNNLHLQLRKTRENPEISRELIKLPSWAGEGMANVSVRIPESRDEAIHIILNKAAKPWYGMSEPVDTHLPALVQRDPSSMDLSDLAIEGRGKNLPAIENKKASLPEVEASGLPDTEAS